jgi:tetratricopeptide (TPR) repeat protein
LVIGAATQMPLAVGQGRAVAESWRDEAFLAGLRARRLFALAESHCQRRSADQSLSVVERGELTVDWIRTLAEHARHSPAYNRESLLRRVHEVAAQFTTAHPEHSLVFLVRTQEALADAAAGELARLEADASPDPAAERTAARKLCRSAATRLEQLDRQLSEFLPQRFRRGKVADELSVEQLASLQHQIRLQAARAQRGLALAYDESSDDWLAALGRGLQLLEPSLRQLTPEMPLYAPLTLEAATQLRLLGRSDAARTMLARLTPVSQQPALPQPAPALSGSLAWAVLAEQLRTAVGQSRWPEAEQLAARSSPAAINAGDEANRAGTDTRIADRQAGAEGEADPAKADWDFARFEALLARWRATTSAARGGGGEVTAIRQQALALLDQIESEHGAYWKHRGDLLLVSIGAATGTRDADLLGRTADSLLAQDRVDEALRTYDQAASAAAAEQDREKAFQWAYKAGLVQQRRERFEDAAERLRAASLAHPEHSQAPLAHLAALWNLAQSLRRTSPPTPAPTAAPPTAAPASETLVARTAERYGEWLADHCRRWPASPTSGDAQSWRGAWWEARGAWADASGAYRAVPATHPAALEAYRGAMRTETRRLAAAVEALPSAAATAVLAQQTPSQPQTQPAGPPPQPAAHAAVVGAEIETWLAQPLPEQLAESLTEDDRRMSAELRFRALWAQPGRESDAHRELVNLSAHFSAQLPANLPATVPASGGAAGTAAIPAAANERAAEQLREWLVTARSLRSAGTPARRAALAPIAFIIVDNAERLVGTASPPTTGDDAVKPQTAAFRATKAAVDELLVMVRAEAFEDSDKPAEAIALWRQIATKNPKSGSAQQAFAEALERSGRREDWQAALEQWRRIAAKSPPRSPRWFRAKLGTVQQLVRLDQRAEAEKLVRFLFESPPPPPESWRQQLEAALKK